MKVLNNLKTNVKLISSFMIIAILTGIVGGMGIYYLRQIDASYTQLIDNHTMGINKLGDISVAFQRVRVNLRDMLLTPTASGSKTYLDTINQLSEEIDQKSTEYERLIVSKEMHDLYKEYVQLLEQYNTYKNEIIALDQRNKDAEALTLMRTDALPVAKALEAKIEEMRALKLKQAEEASALNTAETKKVTIIMIILVVVAVLLGVSMGLIISTSIATPLGIVTRMAQALSAGNTLRQMNEQEKDRVRLRNDEVGLIGKAFDQLISYMQEMGVAATTIAGNDLTTSITPKSEKDELGNAFAKMIIGLRQAIGLVAESASSLGAASEQLASAANQAGQATSQISTTIQQV